MLSKLNSWLTDNETKTRQSCKVLLEQLKRTHLDPVLQKLQGKEAAKVSFDDVINGYTRIKDDYEKSAKGAKDVIAAVFFEFHPVRKPYFMILVSFKKTLGLNLTGMCRFSIECRKIKTKVITPANHKRRR